MRRGSRGTLIWSRIDPVERSFFMKTQVAVVDPLIERLRDAVRLGEVHAIAEQIKNDLESFIPAEGLILPEKFHQAKPDSYASRLLYPHPALGFTALVMTCGLFFQAEVGIRDQ